MTNNWELRQIVLWVMTNCYRGSIKHGITTLYSEIPRKKTFEALQQHKLMIIGKEYNWKKKKKHGRTLLQFTPLATYKWVIMFPWTYCAFSPLSLWCIMDVQGSWYKVKKKYPEIRRMATMEWFFTKHDCSFKPHWIKNRIIINAEPVIETRMDIWLGMSWLSWLFVFQA